MDTIDKNIAINLKKIRKGQNLSLDMLAEKTGVSKSMLGQIERGESNPTIATIAKICEGLRITIEQLVYREKDAMAVVKREQCRVCKNQSGKYTVRMVFPFEKNRSFEIYTAVLESEAELRVGAHGSRSAEYVTVMAGEVSLLYEREICVLQAGDSVCLNGNEEFLFRNSGEKRVELHIVLTII